MNLNERLQEAKRNLLFKLPELKRRKLSEATIMRLRRKRKARRMWAKSPLLAFEMMRKEYPDYTREEFEADLVVKSKQPKKKGKNVLVRYGRYQEMETMRRLYMETGNPEYGLKYSQLRKNITKPYRMRVRINNHVKEYIYPATWSLKLIKEIAAKGGNAKSFEDFENEVEELTKYVPNN